MVEIRTVTTFKSERDEITRAIVNYENNIAQAIVSLAHINAAILIFEIGEDSQPKPVRPSRPTSISTPCSNGGWRHLQGRACQRAEEHPPAFRCAARCEGAGRDDEVLGESDLLSSHPGPADAGADGQDCCRGLGQGCEGMAVARNAGLDRCVALRQPAQHDRQVGVILFRQRFVAAFGFVSRNDRPSFPQA